MTFWRLVPILLLVSAAQIALFSPAKAETLERAPQANEWFFAQAPTRTSQDQIHSLIALSDIVPDLLKDATKLNRDLGELLISQEQIQNRFRQRTDYRRLLSRIRGEPRLISIKTRRRIETTETALDPQTVTAFRQKLLKTAQKYPDPVAELRARLAGQNIGRAKGLVTALINTLPNERRKEVFRMPPEQQIGLLIREMPEELTSKGFKPAAFGWNDPTLSKSEALARLKSFRDVDVDTSSLVELILLFHHLKSDSGFDRENLKAAILRLNEEDLTRLTLKSETEALAADARSALNARGAELKTFNQLVDEMSTRLKKSSMQKSEVKVVSESALTLREIPPAIGILRGFLGSDCATSHSFAFANAPSERIFAIHGADGTAKGYAAMTIVKNPQGRPLIYLHTIAGKRVSAIDARMIVHAIDQAKVSLGAEEVVLPTNARIEENVKALEPRSALEAAADPRNPVEISFLDEDIREEIKTLARHDVTYDDPASNKHGFSLKAGFASSENLPEMTVEVASHHEQVDFRKAPTRNGLVEMALDMTSQGLSDRPIFATLTSLLGLSTPAVARLKETLFNQARLPVGSYLSAVLSEARTLGSDMSERDLRTRWANLFVGLLNSPDFAKPENEQLIKELLKEAIVAKRVDYLEELNRKHPGYLARHPDTLTRMLAKEETTPLAVSLFIHDPELFETLPLSEKARALLLEKMEASHMGLKEALAKIASCRSPKEILTELSAAGSGRPIRRLAATMNARHFMSLSPSSDQIAQFAGLADGLSMNWMRAAMSRADSFEQVLKLIEGSDSAFGILSFSAKERLIASANDLSRLWARQPHAPSSRAAQDRLAKWADSLDLRKRGEFFNGLQGEEFASAIYDRLSEKSRASMPRTYPTASRSLSCQALFEK